MALRFFSPAFASPSPASLRSGMSSFHGIRLQSLPANVASPFFSRVGKARLLCRAAKREEEVKELRAKMTEELNEEVIDLKGELFMLRFQKATGQQFKPSEFRRMRKRIARMLTIKREREIEQGIGRRLSRKLDKQWKRSFEIRPPPSLRKKLEEEKKE